MLLPLVRLQIDLCWKVFLNWRTARTISMKTVKASTSKSNGKPLLGDKSYEIDPDILFYEIEDDDKTEEGEET